MSTQATTPAFTGTQPLTTEQQAIVAELCNVHGLDPSQISFDAFDPTPIFDYEAVSTLTLKLTDIQGIDAIIRDRRIEEIDSFPTSVSRASCLVTLPDGRTRSVEETAYVGETVNGRKLETTRDADGMAQNRAVRRGIRSVGINLWRAHQAFMRSGQKAQGSTVADPRNTFYAEIHVLAEKIGLIVDGNRSQYEAYVAELFDGRSSAADLNEDELLSLRNGLRAMAKALTNIQPAV